MIEDYQYEKLLSRLKLDCDFFIERGNTDETYLMSGSVAAQIEKMRHFHDQLKEKPSWLSLEQIDQYQQRMADLSHSHQESQTISTAMSALYIAKPEQNPEIAIARLADQEKRMEADRNRVLDLLLMQEKTLQDALEFVRLSSSMHGSLYHAKFSNQLSDVQKEIKALVVEKSSNLNDRINELYASGNTGSEWQKACDELNKLTDRFHFLRTNDGPKNH